MSAELELKGAGAPPVTAAAAHGARRRILGNALWSAADFWFQQASQFLTFVVVGNILGPEAVGVMTMGLTVILLAMSILIGSFGDALIQRPELRADHFDTVFWLLMAIALGIAALLIGGAPLFAGAFGEPALRSVLPLLALSLPFIAISGAYQGIIQRAHGFRQLATRSMVSSVVGFAVAVVAARHGLGLYSLVCYFVTQRVLEAGMLVLVSGKRPGLNVTRAAFSDIVEYGKHRTGNNVTYTVYSQVPRVVIGAMAGAGALGLFAIAERVVIALQNGITGVIKRVAFPTLSGLQHDPEGFVRAMRDFILAGNLITLPIFVGLSLTADEAIHILMSDRWDGAVPILRVLCLGVLAQPTTFILHAGALALGHARAMVRLSFLNLVLGMTGALLAAPHGAIAVAYAVMAVNLSTLGTTWFVIRPFLGQHYLALLKAAWPPAAAAAVMAGVTVLASYLIGPLPVIPSALAKVAIGAGVYVLALRLIGPRAFKALIGLVRKRQNAG
jgi:PST family polysaccharide transporter